MLSTLLSKYKFYTFINKLQQGMAPPVLHLKNSLNLNALTKFKKVYGQRSNILSPRAPPVRAEINLNHLLSTLKSCSCSWIREFYTITAFPFWKWIKKFSKLLVYVWNPRILTPSCRLSLSLQRQRLVHMSSLHQLCCHPSCSLDWYYCHWSLWGNIFHCSHWSSSRERSFLETLQLPVTEWK